MCTFNYQYPQQFHVVILLVNIHVFAFFSRLDFKLILVEILLAESITCNTEGGRANKNLTNLDV